MFRLAFPSWVKEGGISENARFICGKWQSIRQFGGLPSCVLDEPEIGLCFFEAAACLDYGLEDLPLKLGEMPCSWHVHLPLDLPFCIEPAPGPAAVRESFYICRRLMQRCEFLNIRCAVLHPPAGGFRQADTVEALALFIELWTAADYPSQSLLLENQPESVLSELSLEISKNSLGACLDLAHLYMNPSKKIDTTGLSGFAELAPVWHVNAPGDGYKGHSSLNSLTPSQAEEYAALFDSLACKGGGTLMLELFRWEKIEESLPFLFNCLHGNKF